MLPLISILVGITVFVTFTPLLWDLLRRPEQWKQFTEREQAFWIRRGLPVKWAGAIKDWDRGWVLKMLVIFCILMALVLTITSLAIPIIIHPYG